MCNSDFWEHIKAIISGGFTPEGLAELDEYADKFTCGQLLYKRFSPSEQYGCTTGGHAHVIASMLAGAEVGSDSNAQGENDFKRQCQRGETQARILEDWVYEANGVQSHQSSQLDICYPRYLSERYAR